jgi:hypothetical protein
MDAAFQESVKLVSEAIKTLGFGVVVALWFMFRTDQRIEKMTGAIEALTESVKEFMRKEGE